MSKPQFPRLNKGVAPYVNTSRENAEATTFLLIDDNNDEAVLMRRVLENRKTYLLLHAKNGLDGLALAQQKSPAVVISDLVMPGMDGFHVVEALRSNPHTCHIPIVITSARDLAPEERKKLNGHVNMIYQKGTLKPSEFALRVIQVAEGK
jgi:threonine synthase